MESITLSMEVTGCVNHCFHCHCRGGDPGLQFMNVETVLKYAYALREAWQKDMIVNLVQEQTRYPDYFPLIQNLEQHGFMESGDKKLLITNGWGLIHRPGFLQRAREHYRSLHFTLYGLKEQHDGLANRIGAFEDILKATEEGQKEGFRVYWMIMLTHSTVEEVEKLLQLALFQGLAREQVVLNPEFHFTGYFMELWEEKPLEGDQIQFLKEQNLIHSGHKYSTEGELIALAEQGQEFDVQKIPLDHFYIDRKKNMYPFLHLYPEFCLGNVQEEPLRKIKERIEKGNVPPLLQFKKDLKAADVFRRYGQRQSRELHSPQSLFDKLSWLAVEDVQE